MTSWPRVRASSSRASPGRSRCGSSPTCWACPTRTATSLERLARDARRRRRQRREDADQDAAGIPVRGLRDYVEDRRREPRDDVLTGLATATFPDGTMPEVGDVVRVATNVFSAGQETTVRLLSDRAEGDGRSARHPGKLREDRSLLPNFIEECLRIESPVKGDFRLSRMPTTIGEDDLGRLHRDGDQRCRQSRPAPLRGPGYLRPDRKNARQHLAFGRGIHSCPGAPLARAETRVGLERLLDRTTDIRISEAHHGPAGAVYNYIPTTSCGASPNCTWSSTS